MDRLIAMQVFTKVVEMNGFSKAADALGLPLGAPTTIIKNLEAHLHVQLMQRTTRHLKLTPKGAEYYERCVKILAEIDDVEHSMADNGKGARGRLRVDMPASLGRLVVMPQIEKFREQFANIDLVVGFGDKLVDLVKDSVDCAIRVGVLEDSTLIARHLGDLETLTAASQSYLQRFGTPSTPDDLGQHLAVHRFSGLSDRPSDFNFNVNGRAVDVKMTRGMSVNDADAYVMCGVNGAGIIQAPHYMLAPHLISDDLIEILPQWRPRTVPISAVYPHSRYVPAKVRVFIEWIVQLFDECPHLCQRYGIKNQANGAAPAPAEQTLACNLKHKTQVAA